MPNTKSFDRLRDDARRDPARARRIDAAKSRAFEEQARFRLAELRQALGITQVELAGLIGKSSQRSPRSRAERSDSPLMCSRRDGAAAAVSLPGLRGCFGA